MLRRPDGGLHRPQVLQNRAAPHYRQQEADQAAKRSARAHWIRIHTRVHRNVVAILVSAVTLLFGITATETLAATFALAYINDTGLGHHVFTGSRDFKVSEIEVFEITD
jgi:hypothetical protein